LRRHRDVLSSGHRKRPRKEASETRQPDVTCARLRPENAKDQGHIGHEAIAHPEHRCASGAGLNIAVVVLYVLVLLGIGFAKHTIARSTIAMGATGALALLRTRLTVLTGQLAHRELTIPRRPLRG
jgi:hypothetical protein